MQSFTRILQELESHIEVLSAPPPCEARLRLKSVLWTSNKFPPELWAEKWNNPPPKVALLLKKTLFLTNARFEFAFSRKATSKPPPKKFSLGITELDVNGGIKFSELFVAAEFSVKFVSRTTTVKLLDIRNTNPTPPPTDMVSSLLSRVCCTFEVLFKKRHPAIVTPLSNAFTPARLFCVNAQFVNETSTEFQIATTAAAFALKCWNSMFDTWILCVKNVPPVCEPKIKPQISRVSSPQRITDLDTNAVMKTCLSFRGCEIWIWFRKSWILSRITKINVVSSLNEASSRISRA